MEQIMENEILECVEEIEGNLSCIRLAIDDDNCDRGTQQEIETLEDQLKNIRKLLEEYECDGCSGLEHRVYELETELETLEDSNLDLDTLVDKMKFECFAENHNKFSLKEFQQLMQ